MIEINVDGRIVSVQETETLYVGSVDIQNCHFTFDNSWGKFSKTAVFRVGTEAHTMLVDEDGQCVLPWELLTRKNIGKQLEVGIYGVSADAKIMTSVWDSLGIIREGSKPGKDARNPVDGIYEQVMAKLQRIYEELGIYDEGLLALTQRAETAAQMASERAKAAERTMEEIRELLENGDEAIAPIMPHCIEYGTLEYHSDTEQELFFHFSQSYNDQPVFIPYVNRAALTVTVEPLSSAAGYYGGKITVANATGEDIAAKISVFACCAYPVGEDGESV